MRSIFQTVSPSRYLQLVITSSSDWCKLHHVVASVCRTSQLTAPGAGRPRTSRVLSVICGSDSKFRFCLFASITLNHELKVGRIFGKTRFSFNWCHKPFGFLEQKRDILWPRIFRVVTFWNKNGMFCGQDFFPNL